MLIYGFEKNYLYILNKISLNGEYIFKIIIDRVNNLIYDYY